MLDGAKRRFLVVGALVAVVSLVSACETTAERQARLEREAYIKSLDVKELKKDLKTVNPDPFAPGKTKPQNIGQFKKN